MIDDLIVYGVLSLLIILLLVNSLRLHLRTKKLVAEFAQASLDKTVIILKLREELDKQNPNSIEKTDGFLKFISDSRDWAFKYIEDVQAALVTFKNKVEPKFDYAKTYGTVVGQSAHSDILEEISVAYEEFKKIMPEDTLQEDKAK
jgi:hypothetical protein